MGTFLFFACLSSSRHFIKFYISYSLSLSLLMSLTKILDMYPCPDFNLIKLSFVISYLEYWFSTSAAHSNHLRCSKISLPLEILTHCVSSWSLGTATCKKLSGELCSFFFILLSFYLNYLENFNVLLLVLRITGFKMHLTLLLVKWF